MTEPQRQQPMPDDWDYIIGAACREPFHAGHLCGTGPVPSINMERHRTGQRLYVWSIPSMIPFGLLALATDDIRWMAASIVIAAIGLLLMFFD